MQTRFTPFMLAHKAKILPLLGDEDITDILEEERGDANVYEYETFHDQPTELVPSTYADRSA